MSISYPLAFPATVPSRLSFSKVSAVGESASPFTFEQQVYAHQGDLLSCAVEFVTASRADASAVIGFLLALNGKEGTFLMGPRNSATARGAATGTPLVNGGSQTGRSLITDGWSNSVTGILKAGDWIQIGSGSSARLYPIAQDANSNGSGQATLELGTRLRSSPSDNAAITVSNPMGLWRLAENAVAWSEELALLYGAIRFSAREAF
jgi:hypothetical protein